MKVFICALTAALGNITLSIADDSPIVSPSISTDNSPSAIADAGQRGAAAAAKDIKAGTFRILYYGIPWSVGRALVDDATGYRVQILGGCTVTGPFSAEVQAYNTAMREWHDANKSAKAPK